MCVFRWLGFGFSASQASVICEEYGQFLFNAGKNRDPRVSVVVNGG